MSLSEFQEFAVVVDNPQKHFDPLETYISFRVTTKVSSIKSTTEQGSAITYLVLMQFLLQLKDYR